MHAWDVLVEQDLTDDAAIEDALAAVLEVAPKSVRVIDEITPSLAVSAGTMALVERRHLSGDARLQLTVYLQDTELIARTSSRRVTLMLLKELAARLETSLFVGDGGPDPTGFLLIRPNGQLEPIALDINEDREWVSALPNQDDTGDDRRSLQSPRSPAVR